jgi:hypothetical protein
MTQVKYPENIELKKRLRRGDIALIAQASGKSHPLVIKVFEGTRKMKPAVKRVYDIVVKMNGDLEQALGIKLTAENLPDKKPNV